LLSDLRAVAGEREMGKPERGILSLWLMLFALPLLVADGWIDAGRRVPESVPSRGRP
jgi:hypothetical protein